MFNKICAPINKKRKKKNVGTYYINDCFCNLNVNYYDF